MREILAERVSRKVIAVAALATLGVAGASVARVARLRHEHHAEQHRRMTWYLAHCAEHHTHALQPIVQLGPLAPLGPPAPPAPPAPKVAIERGSQSVDLDGDGVPEVVSMTFSEHRHRLITTVTVERMRDGSLQAVTGDPMVMSAPVDPAPCIGSAVAYGASSPGGGRIELTHFERATGAGAHGSCVPAGIVTFRYFGGHILGSDADLR
jgi:hypothetical protein